MRKIGQRFVDRTLALLGIRIIAIDVVQDGRRITRLWRVVRLVEPQIVDAPAEPRGPLEIRYDDSLMWRVVLGEGGEHRLVSSGLIPEW